MDYDGLVQRIYDSVSDEHSFANTLAEIARALDAPFARLLVTDGQGRLTEAHFHGHDEPPFANRDTNVFERLEVGNELPPKDVRYTLYAKIELDAGFRVTHAFMREPGSGPFEPEQVHMASRLLPHLRRAFDLRRLVGTYRDQLNDQRGVLDLVPALAILDSTGRVLFANATAERLLAEGDGLHLKDGRLYVEAASSAQQLDETLVRTTAFAEGSKRPPDSAAPPSVVEVARGRAHSLGLVFFPLRPGNSLRCEQTNARVLVVFHDPDSLALVDPELLSKLYPLTPTEALLAASLAQGHSVADFARKRGCSEGTARTHLKRVLEKTKTCRQADLVRVLLSSAALRIVDRR